MAQATLSCRIAEIHLGGAVSRRLTEGLTVEILLSFVEVGWDFPVGFLIFLDILLKSILNQII